MKFRLVSKPEVQGTLHWRPIEGRYYFSIGEFYAPLVLENFRSVEFLIGDRWTKASKDTLAVLKFADYDGAYDRTLWGATNRILLDFLLSGAKATSIEVLERFGLSNLSIRIEELKRRGYKIKTEKGLSPYGYNAVQYSLEINQDYK